MDSNNDAQRNIIPIAAGAGALLFFLGAVCLITLTCCVVHKRRNTLNQDNGMYNYNGRGIMLVLVP